MEGGTAGDGTGPSWALAVGIVLVALTGLIAYGTADEDFTSSERVGYVFGSILTPLVMAIVGRFLWVRLGPGQQPTMDWAWLLLITGILGVFFALGRAGSEAQDAEEGGTVYSDTIEAARQGEETCPELRLTDLGPFRAADAGPGFARRLEAGAGDLAESLQAYALRNRGGVVGYLVSSPFDPSAVEEEGGYEAFREGVLEGVRMRYQDEGVETEDLTIAGTPALAAIFQGEHQLSSTAGCNTIFVGTATRVEGVRALAAVLDAQP